MDDAGEFIEEYKLTSLRVDDLYGVCEDRLVFSRRDYPADRKKSRLYDIDNVICLISKDGKDIEEVCSLTHKQFLVSLAQGGGGMNWDPFYAVIGDGQLYVCRSQEYQIEALDMGSKEIKKRFRRKYPRVSHEMTEGEKMFTSRFNAPKKKYEPDIKGLLYGDGRLWVQTSTEDEEKGTLFDVFDSEGQFLDNFFIDIKGSLLAVRGGYLYFSQSDPEELPLIVKYKILEPIGPQ